MTQRHIGFGQGVSGVLKDVQSPLPFKKPDQTSCSNEKRNLEVAEKAMIVKQTQLEKAYANLEDLRLEYTKIQDLLQKAQHDRNSSIIKGGLSGAVRGIKAGSHAGAYGIIGGAVGGGIGGGAIGFVKDEAMIRLSGKNTSDELKIQLETALKKVKTMEVSIKNLYIPELSESQNNLKAAIDKLNICQRR